MRYSVLTRSAGTDLDTLMDNTKYLVLLSKVYYKQNKLEQSLLHLTKARDMQNRQVSGFHDSTGV